MKHLAILFGVGGISVFSVLLLKYRTQTSLPENSTALVALSTSNKDTEITKIIRLAEAFKATLKEEQRSLLQLSYSKGDAQKWSNLPQAFTRQKRVGLSFGSLTATQQQAAIALLKVVAGTGANEGWDELQQLVNADDYLAVKDRADIYGKAFYYIAFLGTPSATGTFEIQFGGHHLAFGNTYKDGVLISATPSFRGVEPFGTFTLEGKNNQPLNGEQAAFAKLLASLSKEELAIAKLNNTFSDLLVGAQRDGAFPNTRSGVKCSALSAAQKKLVLTAIKTYVQDIDEKNAAAIMSKYTKELDDTYIAYSGTPELLTRNDYIRIDGPSIWIEYSCQAGIVLPGTHPHSVWRDKTKDYGGN